MFGEALSSIYAAAKYIYDQSRQAQCNRDDCKDLGDIVQRVEFMLRDLEITLSSLQGNQLNVVDRALSVSRPSAEGVMRVRIAVRASRWGPPSPLPHPSKVLTQRHAERPDQSPRSLLMGLP